MTNSSAFVWHDLMTTDVEKASMFYAELFGWSTRPVDAGMFQLTIVTAGEPERTIAAILPLDSGLGLSSHWVPYVATDDLDACCRRIEAHGGSVCIRQADHPCGGRFAFLNDPQKGFFSALQGRLTMPASTGFGQFWLDKLLADDPDTIAGFYEGVFGWKAGGLRGSASSPQIPLEHNGRSVAWLAKRPPIAPMVQWLPHVAVFDVDATTARAKELGATVLVSSKEISGLGRYAVLLDPSYAPIAVISPDF